MSKQSWRGSTLLNPEPPVLVSCGGLDHPNLITIGWTGTICTQPSMVSISVRPERFSHHLIQESGQFAINLPTEALVRSVDWCGVKSGRDVDKFAACGLHAEPGSVLTDCPVLAESPVNLECKVTQRIPLGSHDLFLAEVVACDVDEAALALPARKLSGGQKRRTALLRALWAPGDTLLLDEPFTGMDPAAVQASIALLRERVEGRPVLLATHDRAAIDALGWPVLELQKLAQPGAACNSTNKGLQ